MDRWIDGWIDRWQKFPNAPDYIQSINDNWLMKKKIFENYT